MAGGGHRFLLIGHGIIAERYAAVLKALPHAEVCGVVGRNAERAWAFADRHDIGVYGTDIREVAKRTKATAAIVCTPNGAHEAGVLAAAEAGLHCLCEKPLAIEPARQTAMITACRAAGVKLGVSYMRRFSPHFRWLKQAMDDGLLGEIMVVDVTLKHYRPPSYYESWHGTKATDGGGPFMQQGSHIIDMALYLCGGYERVVQAVAFRLRHDIETEDHGYAVVSYRNGAVGLIEASTACAGTGSESIEVTGALGTIRADFNGIVSSSVLGLEVPGFAAGDVDGLFHELLIDFTAAIEEDRDPHITGESASVATKCIREIYDIAGEPLRC